MYLQVRLGSEFIVDFVTIDHGIKFPIDAPSPGNVSVNMHIVAANSAAGSINMALATKFLFIKRFALLNKIRRYFLRHGRYVPR